MVKNMTLIKIIRRLTTGCAVNKKLLSGVIVPCLALAGFLCTQVPLFALSSGGAAGLELGQASMTRAYINAVTSSGTYSPGGIAVTAFSGGRVYLADTANNRVLWWTAANYTTGHTADGVIGQADFTGALANQGSVPGNNTLSGPSAVAADSAGNVWVADTGNNRVLRFLLPVSNGPAADTVLGQPNFLAADGNLNSATPAAASLYSPRGVALDGSDNIWVADYNNNRALRYPSTVALTNGGSAAIVLGQADFVSNSAAAAAAGLNSPAAVTVDAAGNLWVADSGNSRVLEYEDDVSSGSAAVLVLGQPDFVSASPNQGVLPVASGTLNLPLGVAVAGTTVWVADSINNRVLRFLAPDHNGQGADLVLGQPGFVTDAANGGTIFASAAGLNAPGGVAADGAGNLWIADTSNNRALRQAGPSSNNAAAGVALGQKDLTQAAVNTPEPTSLYGPSAMAVSTTTGHLYVADSVNNRVLWWNNFRSFTNGQPADGVLGQADFSSVQPNRGGSASFSTLYYPVSVAVDGAEKLWVADNANNRVLRFSAPSSNGQAADRVLGEPDASTVSGGKTQNLLQGPYSVAVDTAGRVWVADYANNRVVRFSDLTSGAAADYLLGQGSDYTSSASGNLATSLDGPSGVSVDSAGNVWVADTNNSRVLEYVNLNKTAALVLGQPGFGSSTPDTTQAALSYPESAVRDSAGNIWVGDTANSRALRFDPPFSSGMAAAMVLGQADYNTGSPNGGAAPGAATLFSPNAVSDGSNNLWIADYNNNRVLKFDPLYGTVLSPVFSGVTPTGISASWTLVPGSNYTIVLSSSSGYTAPVSSQTTVSGGNSAVFGGLSPATTYYLEVKLASETDAGFVPNQASTVTLVSPGTALFPALTASSNTVAASWTAVTGATYNAVFSLNSGFSPAVSSGTLTGNTTAYTGLASLTSYYFEVKLSTEADAAYPQNVVSALTSEPVTLLYPSLSVVSAARIDASWTAVPGSNYTVVAALDSGFTSIVSNTVETAASKSFGFLAPGTRYYFEVKIATEPATSFAANTISAQTLPSATPLHPGVTAITSTTFSAAWDTVAGAQYVAVLASDSGYTAILSSGPLSSNTTGFTGLTPLGAYYFEVKLATETDAAYAANHLALVMQTRPLALTGSLPGIITPGAGSIMLTVTGEGFGPTTTLKLARAGYADVNPLSTTVYGSTAIVAAIGQPIASGRWNVVVSYAGNTLILADALTLLEPQVNNAKVFQGIFKPRQGQAAQLTISLLSPGEVSINIYDSLGRFVKRIFKGVRAAGNYVDAWDGTASNGRSVASGVYLVRFECPGFSTTKRVVVIK